MHLLSLRRSLSDGTTEPTTLEDSTEHLLCGEAFLQADISSLMQFGQSLWTIAHMSCDVRPLLLPIQGGDRLVFRGVLIRQTPIVLDEERQSCEFSVTGSTGKRFLVSRSACAGGDILIAEQTKPL